MSDGGSWGGHPGPGGWTPPAARPSPPGPPGPPSPPGPPGPSGPTWGQPPPTGTGPYGQPPTGTGAYGQPQPYGQPAWAPPPTGGGGKGPLIAVLVLLGALFVGAGVFVFASSSGDDDDDEQTGTTLSRTSVTTAAPTTTTVPVSTTANGTIAVFDLAEGDCWNDPAQGDQASVAQVVACETAHDLEVYAVYNVEGFTDFPGDQQMGDSVYDECINRFVDFVGLDYFNSDLDITALFPTAETWGAGDREATCSVGDPAGQTTGTLRGAAR
jgi:hypothetical protein